MCGIIVLFRSHFSGNNVIYFYMHGFSLTGALLGKWICLCQYLASQCNRNGIRLLWYLMDLSQPHTGR